VAYQGGGEANTDIIISVRSLRETSSLLLIADELSNAQSLTDKKVFPRYSEGRYYLNGFLELPVWTPSDNLPLSREHHPVLPENP